MAPLQAIQGSALGAEIPARSSDDLKGRFDFARHPDVVAGRKTQQAVRREVFSFLDHNRDGVVTLQVPARASGGVCHGPRTSLAMSEIGRSISPHHGLNMSR